MDNTSTAIGERIYFLGTFEDKEYIQRLKPCVSNNAVSVSFTEPLTLVEVEHKCRSNGITKVLSTSPKLLSKLFPLKKAPAISDYAGSLVVRNGITYVFISPLKQLVTVPYGEFLTKRYASKLTTPSKWKNLPKFSWTLITTENYTEALAFLSSCMLVAVDIETTPAPPRIECIGYTGITASGVCMSYVLPMDTMQAVAWMRTLNYIQPAKVLQNGKYDIAYLAMYNAPLHNYLFDTAAMMHCWYSELPKSLDAIASFFIRESFYWKDLAQTQDRYEYYKYNALDAWHTLMVAMLWLLEAPAWAKENYKQEFPLVFPCHMCEMTGILRDKAKLEEAYNKQEELRVEKQRQLEAMTVPNFNANSSKQVMELLRILGCTDIKSSDETALKKAALKHPLNSRILNTILELRKIRKLLSTYLVAGKEYKDVILYSLTPWGTDTGRLASMEHHFWCGLQIQNIPRGKIVKSTLAAFPNYRIAECDLKQAESRDTAYISGDTALIAAVESTKDFHCTNASAFFGIPYEQLYDDSTKEVLNTPIRNLAKNTNHGASYNMGKYVMVDTMGEEKVWMAQKLLGLPKFWTSAQVTQYLLDTFHKTYPMIKKSYYEYVINTVAKTRLLVGATGWTRYCFGNPRTNKMHLNALVAHCPQSLNAMKLNKGFMKVFYELAIPHADEFVLNAQIHDSLLFQFKEGKEYYAEEVRKRMEIPLTIKSTTGVTYTYIVPADIKAGKDGKGAKYWSEI